LYGSHNAEISAAAADVSFHEVGDLGRGRIRSSVQQGDSRHDHAGCAVGALHGLFVQECLLQGMQAVTVGKAFNGCDLAADDSACAGDARPLGLAVDQHSACAALPFATTVLGSGQVPLIAQDTEESSVIVGIGKMDISIHVELDS
jgi:hypothetical protein